MKRFEFLEHTADTILKAYGNSLEEAFSAAADGLFAVMTDLDRIEPKRTVTVEAESIDREGLLVKFLSELILRHETENIVMKDFEVSFTGQNSLRARGSSEQWDESKHEHGMHVKAVSYHMLEMHDGGGDEESFVQVVLDV